MVRLMGGNHAGPKRGAKKQTFANRRVRYSNILVAEGGIHPRPLIPRSDNTIVLGDRLTMRGLKGVPYSTRKTRFFFGADHREQVTQNFKLNTFYLQQ